MSIAKNTTLTMRITELHKQLGVPEDYAFRHRLRPCEECREMVSIGQDIFGREQNMLPQAAAAWSDMKSAAASKGVELQVVSAYRSIDYQSGLVEKKLANGQPIHEILRVSAAPGYSEHHTGRALDITTPGFEPLEEEFENSPAFDWLGASAAEFGFRMSFPRDNPHNLCYEPWHWCWQPEPAEKG